MKNAGDKVTFEGKQYTVMNLPYLSHYCTYDTSEKLSKYVYAAKACRYFQKFEIVWSYVSNELTIDWENPKMVNSTKEYTTTLSWPGFSVLLIVANLINLIVVFATFT